MLKIRVAIIFLIVKFLFTINRRKQNCSVVFLFCLPIFVLFCLVDLYVSNKKKYRIHKNFYKFATMIIVELNHWTNNNLYKVNRTLKKRCSICISTLEL